MIAAEADWIELGRDSGAVHDQITQEPDGWANRINPLLLCYVFFQGISLQCAGKLCQIVATTFGYCHIHGIDNPGRRVDRQGHRDFLEIDPVEQAIDIVDRVNGDTTSTDFAKCHGIV